MGDFGYEGCIRGMFLNYIYKLNRITKHGCFSQEEFTFVESMVKMTTFLVSSLMSFS